MAFETRSIGQIALDTGLANERFSVDQAELLLRPDPVSTAWKNQLKGRSLAEASSKPDYGDPHPSPGAAKVPEVVKGFFMRSRI